ncbi:hypothetical protein GS518_05245 [Leptospira interrogans]|uniref:SLEI domain protein, PF07620 family n=1 Tax=Leptospira interrogans serovar Icterohaemorrhagiae TaxID=90062 RepID=A0AAW4JZ51_LEPIR|nr:hypothetical protein [Leptospira interrogans]ARB97035.1 hypothetical protein A6J42_17570 [Leptospira interrogans serovar Copenhageni]EMJ72959.1 hypothetical protein LEP1GSC034_3894 [Leptospira interrogans str. 2003000735]EMJ77112.1 hypothetical protein LEP1GSC032_0903 [Leptospira interrogans str. 2002000631]EMO93378.1 hypothetical protein LEP1GSC109_1449 [Leptospira interrogans str. UI 13372]KAA5549697.1 hypothetical protein F3G11_16280 [Leptospira interrogans serovar Copenhageni]
MNKLNLGKDFVFNRFFNLFIGAESAVRQRRIRPIFLTYNLRFKVSIVYCEFFFLQNVKLSLETLSLKKFFLFFYLKLR